MNQKDQLRDFALKCISLLQENCPGVQIPPLNCILQGSEAYIPPGIINNVNALETNAIAFCDSVEQTEMAFYNRASSGENYNPNATEAPPSTLGDPTAWNGRGFPHAVTSQLPPLSQFVPTSAQLPSGTSSSSSLKVEQRVTTTTATSTTTGGTFWKRNDALETFLNDANQESRDDTDSSSGCGVPPRLNTANSDVDKASTLSSSM